ncbi:MAG: hypothetical protein R3D55_11685 [Chloroflexota bacterium]
MRSAVTGHIHSRLPCKAVVPSGSSPGFVAGFLAARPKLREKFVNLSKNFHGHCCQGEKREFSSSNMRIAAHYQDKFSGFRVNGQAIAVMRAFPTRNQQ